MTKSSPPNNPPKNTKPDPNNWIPDEIREEFKVKISTTGKLTEYEHKIDKNFPGDSLSKNNALQVARLFLSDCTTARIIDCWNLNNWELVKDDKKIETGEQFLGTMIGDYSRTGISTMLNTGTIIG